MLTELDVSANEVTQEQIDEWYQRKVGERKELIDLLRLSANAKPEHYVPPNDTKLGSDLWVDLSPRGSAELNQLFGVRVFDNPKPSDLIRRMIGLATSSSEKHIILDFFAGTSSAAHALFDSNREDGGNRRFIMVQLQEPVDESVPSGKNAANLDLKTIADIGKERIRRVIEKLKNEAKGQQDLLKNRQTPEDLGFRVFTLAESNYRQWCGVGDRDGEKYADEMELFTDPLIPGWEAEEVVWEVALKEGYGLCSTVEEVKGVKGNRLWRVTDPDRERSFHICLDDVVETGTVPSLALSNEDLFVCRDVALTDELAANLALTCRLKTI